MQEISSENLQIGENKNILYALSQFFLIFAMKIQAVTSAPKATLYCLSLNSPNNNKISNKISS